MYPAIPQDTGRCDKIFYVVAMARLIKAPRETRGSGTVRQICTLYGPQADVNGSNALVGSLDGACATPIGQSKRDGRWDGAGHRTGAVT